MTIPKEALDAARTVLDGQDALHCIRVWEAWQHGTMAEDDFVPVTDDDEAVSEIVGAILEAALPHLREQIAQEIEAIPNNYPAGPRNIWAKAITTAARIARGEA